MDPNLYGLIELILVFGVVLGFAVWQLIVLERGKKAAKKTSVVSQAHEKNDRPR